MPVQTSKSSTSNYSQRWSSVISKETSTYGKLPDTTTRCFRIIPDFNHRHRRRSIENNEDPVDLKINVVLFLSNRTAKACTHHIGQNWCDPAVRAVDVVVLAVDQFIRRAHIIIHAGIESVDTVRVGSNIYWEQKGDGVVVRKIRSGVVVLCSVKPMHSPCSS